MSHLAIFEMMKRISLGLFEDGVVFLPGKPFDMGPFQSYVPVTFLFLVPAR